MRLLTDDRKKNYIPRQSYMLTTITVLLLLNFVSFSSRGFEQAQANLFSLDNIYRVASLGIAAVLLILSLVKMNKICIPGKAILFLGAYWAVGVISLVNGQWFLYSIVKLFEYAVVLLYAFYVYNLEKRGGKAFRQVFGYLKRFFEYMILSVLIGLIISPGKALYSGLNEYSAIRDAVLPFILSGWLIQITSTSLGYFAAFLAYFQLINIIKHPTGVLDTAKLIVYLLVMVLAQCRMAIVGFCLIGMFLLMLNCKKKKSVLLITIAGIGLILNIEMLFSFLQRGQNLDMLLSLSGRTEWWEYALSYFLHTGNIEKIIGSGFASAEKIIAYQSNTAMYTLDSEFLAVLIGTGVLGTAAWLGSWVYQISTAFKAHAALRDGDNEDEELWLQTAGMVMMLGLRMITATTLAITTYYLLIYIVSALAFQVLSTRMEKRQ